MAVPNHGSRPSTKSATLTANRPRPASTGRVMGRGRPSRSPRSTARMVSRAPQATRNAANTSFDLAQAAALGVRLLVQRRRGHPAGGQPGDQEPDGMVVPRQRHREALESVVDVRFTHFSQAQQMALQAARCGELQHPADAESEAVQARWIAIGGGQGRGGVGQRCTHPQQRVVGRRGELHPEGLRHRHAPVRHPLAAHDS
jgi:hypothetical protein